ncbi:MAG TPA: hypothetical protein VFT41_05535 [Gemmatimonadaceae bacterium]|nr:hypothetical protein [Gemmatimonadaceae bacterium]
MASFFPRQTIELRLEEARAFRRLSFNLVEMALLTGVVLRLYRSVALTHGSPTSWVYIAGTFVLGLVFLCAMATAHLANFPIKRWLWRAPLFALGVVGGEMAVSLLLIWMGREPTGTARAGFGDWPGMALSTFWTREAIVCAWAALLALIVSVIRRGIVAAELHEKREREHQAGA